MTQPGSSTFLQYIFYQLLSRLRGQTFYHQVYFKIVSGTDHFVCPRFKRVLLSGKAVFLRLWLCCNVHAKVCAAHSNVDTTAITFLPALPYYSPTYLTDSHA